MKKVLVIEDNKEIRESIIDLLGLKNYKISSAKNGKEGYIKIMLENPDIIICDVMMPGMDGYDVLRKLADTNKKNTPFILLSARSTEEDVKRGLKAGATDYLIKPFKAQKLFETIECNILL